MATPDIGSIVSMIMSNPALVEQIAGMAKSAQSEEANTEETVEITNPPTSEPRETPPLGGERRIHRVKLANAMKPYLSEGRRRAIDAMMSIADILDITREKK